MDSNDIISKLNIVFLNFDQIANGHRKRVRISLDVDK